MRFEKSTQIEEDFYSGLLEQDVAVKGSVTVKGYHNRATYAEGYRLSALALYVNQTGKQTRMG